MTKTLGKIKKGFYTALLIATLPALNWLLSLVGISPLTPEAASELWGGMQAAYYAIAALIPMIAAWLFGSEEGDVEAVREQLRNQGLKQLR